ncbi:proteasome-associated protein ECM29 [Chloropicon primus]|uniref:Proteasome-associated protein ECM29 n=2 Tax=Chloropicon primus TaxID=1764295 RepID=A0A5B8MNM5_9CHLO|nr:proteasome-associated protein ECM29 [Chloropicon primus]|eukprot:QDZ21911.1 proteasome-associated protein ECM29 [Chloropicon primus]
MADTEEARRVQALDRVLTRLALTSEASIPKVLERLLPAVIAELNVPSNLVLQKVIEILSHVNRIVSGAQSDAKIPVDALLDLCHSEKASQVARSYALMYIEKGLLREDARFQASRLTKILNLFASHFNASSAKYVLFRLVLVSLSSGGLGSGISMEDLNVSKSVQDRAEFVGFCVNFMLYQGPYNRNTETRVTSPGLSPDLMAMLQCQDETYENTVSRKVHLLKFLIKLDAEVELLTPLLLVAACDPNDAVSSLGDQLLRKKCAISNVKPLVDLEDHRLIHKLYLLFHGSLEQAPEVSKKIEPASLVVRLRILGCFIHSLRAANCFPLTVKTIFECLYSATSNARLKLVGMEYSIWVLQHASQDQLASLGPLVLKGLIKFLDQTQLNSYDRSSVRMREFSYEAISELGKRLPQAFANDVGIIGDLMRKITVEDEAVKVSAMEAMRLLASAYKSTGSDVKAKLEQMLTRNSVASPNESLRLLSIQWASSVFKTQELHGVYLLLVATADESIQIRDEANKLLRWNDLRDEARDKKLKTSDLVDYFFAKNPDLKSLEGERRTHQNVLLHMLRAIRCTRTGELNHSLETDLSYAPLIAHALQSKETALLIEAISSLLIEANADPPKFLCSEISKSFSDLKRLVGHTNERVRKGSARLCGFLSSALEPQESMKEMGQILEELEKMTVKKHLEKMHAVFLMVVYGFAWKSPEQGASDVTRFLNILKQHFDLSDMRYPLNGVVAEIAGITALCDVTTEEEVLAFKDNLKALAEKSPVPDTVSSALVSLGRLCRYNAPAREISSFLLGLIPAIKEEGTAFALGEAFTYVFGHEPNMREVLLFDQIVMEESLKECIYGAGSQDASEISEDSMKHCSELLDIILSKYVVHSDPNVRRNASVILLSIIKGTAAKSVVSAKILDIQSALLELVKDTNEITQEMASQGISIIYVVSEGESRSILVENLVEGLTAARLQPKKQKIDNNTELFEGDMLGKDPQGKKIQTYKHLCSIANDIGGGSDMVYKFINLFNEKSLLQSKKGAALGLRTISKIAENELAPLLPRIVPKLYRLLHDPSPGVQESMEMFWCSLVDNPTTTVTLHFPLIMEELLQQLTSNLWRNRQSSATALSSLIQGRTWAELQEYFERLWLGAFRVIDDIKETVRTAAISLAVSLQRTTARLCEDGNQEGDRSPAAIVFPTLLTKGITSAVKEVKSISLQVLYHLTKFSDKRLLSQYMVQISSCLLECLSGLESTSMNYIEQHADRVGIDKEELDNLRIQAANASMVGDMLDRISACADTEVLPDLSSKLSDLLKNGFGTNTRAGTARFLSSVTLRMRYDMKPCSKQLLRALSSSFDSTPAICRTYASSFAQLSKFSEEKHVDARMKRLIEAVQDEDSNIQRSGALYIIELCRQAPDVFARYKNRILPLSFCLMHRSETKVSSLFTNIWDEGAPSDSAAMRLYHLEIGELCVEGLKSDQWKTRKSSSIAVTKLVKKSSGMPLSNASVLCEALIACLGGRYWDGKEDCIHALSVLCSENADSVAKAPGIEKVLSALLSALKRKKTAIAACNAVSLLSASSGIGSSGDKALLILGQLLDLVLEGHDEEDEDEEASKKRLEKVRIAAIQCLTKVWGSLSSSTQASEITDRTLQVLKAAISNESEWRVRDTAVESAKSILSYSSLDLPQHSKWLCWICGNCLSSLGKEQREKSLTLLLQLLEVIVTKCSSSLQDGWATDAKEALTKKAAEVKPSSELHERFKVLLTKV